MRPTHVMVATAVECKACCGTGETSKLGFEVIVRPDGTTYRPCPVCLGAKFEQHAMTLADFAALFTYGEVIDFVSLDEHPTRSRQIRVREDQKP